MSALLMTWPARSACSITFTVLVILPLCPAPRTVLVLLPFLSTCHACSVETIGWALPFISFHPLSYSPAELPLSHSLGSLDRLADLVGGSALAGAVIRGDDEIVRSANGQTAYGRGCDVAHVNGSRIEAWSLTDIDFIASHGCAGDRAPRDGCRLRGC